MFKALWLIRTSTEWPESPCSKIPTCEDGRRLSTFYWSQKNEDKILLINSQRTYSKMEYGHQSLSCGIEAGRRLLVSVSQSRGPCQVQGEHFKRLPREAHPRVCNRRVTCGEKEGRILYRESCIWRTQTYFSSEPAPFTFISKIATIVQRASESFSVQWSKVWRLSKNTRLEGIANSFPASVSTVSQAYFALHETSHKVQNF